MKARRATTASLLLAGLLWLTGAGPTAPPPSPPGPAVCVPASLPPFGAWALRHAAPILLIDEHGRPVFGVHAAYEAGGPLHTLWAGPILALVDPAPGKPSAEVWYDRGALTPEGRLRAVPRQACDWARASPQAKGESR